MASFQAQIQDAFGNNRSDSGTNVSISLNGGGTFSGTTNHNTDANGKAAFDTVSVSQAGNGKTITASATGLTGATSSSFNVTAVGTTTALATSTNSIVYGQSVTFTATVTSGGGTPTGTVTFKDGATTLGTGTLNGSAVATFSTNKLTVTGSPHSITASYASDGNFNSSTSSIVSQTINNATLTVSGITANNKTYDGTNTASLNLGSAALVGVVSGDTVNLSSNSAAGTFSSKTIGTSKTVTVSGLTISGASSGNYSLTQPTTTANISSATLTVTANDTNRVYGAANPAFTASYSGFASGDNSGVLNGSPSFSTTANTVSNVGFYSITVTNGTLSATNYTFTFVNGQLTITQASTTNVVSVSANPSVTTSNVTLTATLTAVVPGSGTPTGTVQFLADGSPVGSPAALSGGVANFNISSLAHGYRTIAAQYAGDGNFFGSTNNFASTLLINSTPTTGTFTLSATKNTAATLPAVKLANAGKDADQDALSITAVNAASAQGGTVSLVSGTITYTPPTNYVGSDSFTYTIADTFGATASGTVQITVTTSTSGNPTYNITGAVISGGITLKGAGIPNRTNVVQRTTSMSPPITWTPIGTNVAGANGLWQFTDPNPSNPAFYRSVTQ